MSENSPEHAAGGTLPASPEEVTLTLHRAEALVAFNLVARLVEDQEDEALREIFEHPAEPAALWALLSAFEQVLNEPFSEDYPAELDKARDEVIAHFTEDE